MTATTGNIPAHIAIIMDGNGRWATQRGLPRTKGHKAGTKAARAIVVHSRELGVRHLTLYTFSKENWSRPKEEVGTLFDLLISFLRNEQKLLLEKDIQLRVLGDLDGLPLAVRTALKRVIAATDKCSSMTLNLALNYGGRDEIVRACKKIVEQGIPAEEISDETFAQSLYTAGQPDPDLVIRTSGEIRISNYLLFQTAYSEFHFTEVLWPDFTPDHLDAAIEDLNSRQRRFGKTGQQLEDEEK